MERGEFAQPVDDFEAQELARQLLAAHRPELTEEQLTEEALRLADSVKILENDRANRRALSQSVDAVFDGQDPKEE